MKTKKKVKVGTFVAIALVVPIFFVVAEYLRHWRYSLNSLVGSRHKGW